MALEYKSNQSICPEQFFRIEQPGGAIALSKVGERRKRLKATLNFIRAIHRDCAVLSLHAKQVKKTEEKIRQSNAPTSGG